MQWVMGTISIIVKLILEHVHLCMFNLLLLEILTAFVYWALKSFYLNENIMKFDKKIMFAFAIQPTIVKNMNFFLNTQVV